MRLSYAGHHRTRTGPGLLRPAHGTVVRTVLVESGFQPDCQDVSKMKYWPFGNPSFWPAGLRKRHAGPHDPRMAKGQNTVHLDRRDAARGDCREDADRP